MRPGESFVVKVGPALVTSSCASTVPTCEVGGQVFSVVAGSSNWASEHLAALSMSACVPTGSWTRVFFMSSPVRALPGFTRKTTQKSVVAPACVERVSVSAPEVLMGAAGVP